jgi:hypothetical protein
VAEDSIHELRHPIQCLLWEHPERAKAKFSEIFDEVEEYEDSSHLNRALYECKECGQLYRRRRCASRALDFGILPRLAPPKKSMEESDFNSCLLPCPGVAHKRPQHFP